MTEQEIQAAIDKGGFLVSMSKYSDNLNEIHFNNVRIKKGRVYFDSSRFFSAIKLAVINGEDSYGINGINWREATPEEVEKYVPKQYRK